MRFTWIPQVPKSINNFLIVGGFVQAVIVILFCIFTKWDAAGYNEGQYGMFQDVNVMIFIGFGFLFCLLPRYGWSALSITICIGAMSIEWFILCDSWITSPEPWADRSRMAVVSINSVTGGVFCAAAVLIAVAGILGRTSMQQLVVMMFVMIPCYCFNMWAVLYKIGSRDTGGTQTIHCFGAFFGFAVSYILGHTSEHKMKRRAKFDESSNYNTNVLAMIGTLFLWCYYPSFNAFAVGDPEGKFRATYQTYLGLVGAAVTSIILSDAKHSKANTMIHMQSGILAGGVTIGCAADMNLAPWGALLMGSLGATLACTGIAYLTPWLEEKGVHDTCDCMSVHGITAYLSTFASMVAFSFDVNKDYLTALGTTKGKQAGLQLAGVVTTTVVGLVTGGITGIIMAMFSNQDHWYDESAQKHFD